MIEIVSEISRFSIVLGLWILQSMHVGKLGNVLVNKLFVVSISIWVLLETMMLMVHFNELTGLLPDAHIARIDIVTMLKKIAQLSVLTAIILHFYILKKDSYETARPDN